MPRTIQKAPAGESPTPQRFRLVFDREPRPDELAVFSRAHELLVLRAPARLKRRTARVICRL